MATSFTALADPIPFNDAMDIINKMDIHEMVMSCCWHFEVVLVPLDITPGQVVAKDIIAFLHVKSFDCRLRPALKVTIRCSVSSVGVLTGGDKIEFCCCSLGRSCWLDIISRLGKEESELDFLFVRVVVQK